MKIIIHPKARTALIALLSMALLSLILLTLRPWLFSRPEKSETGITRDAQAAVDAVTAFYTLDYTAPPELWISNLCVLTTEAGCAAIRSFYAPAVQTLIQNSRIQTRCTVQPVQRVEDRGDIRIWKVTVTLDRPWAGLEASTQDVYVEVSRVHGRWLMNRILFEKETDRFITPTN